MEYSMKIDEDLWIGQHTVMAHKGVIAMILGSCIGLFIYDPVKKVCGAVHIQHAEPLEDGLCPNNPFRVATTASPMIIGKVLESGGERPNLQAYLTGGASMMDNVSKYYKIGEKNEISVVKSLARAGVPIRFHKTGGKEKMRVLFDVSCGKIIINNEIAKLMAYPNSIYTGKSLF